jgi:hypothetical protein
MVATISAKCSAEQSRTAPKTALLPLLWVLSLLLTLLSSVLPDVGRAEAEVGCLSTAACSW